MILGAITGFAAHNGGSTVYGIDVFTSGSNNTKGSWTEIASSTAFAADGLFVVLARSTTARKFLVDIGIGAAAAETVLIGNIQYQSGDDPAGNCMVLPIPVAIANGTRIAARAQSNNGTGPPAVNVSVYPVATDGFPTNWTAVTTLGADTADSTTAQIDPGAVANTKGAWTQITASTTNALRGLVLLVSLQANQAPVLAGWKLDIGTGAAAAETVVIGDLMVNSGGNAGDLVQPAAWPMQVAIPASTRIAVRAQCSITDATDRLIDVSILGLEGTTVATTSGGGPLVVS